ncbi:MAG: phosphoglycerate kinase [Spirochaetales bacterium]|nr:phosphoglycerate kinase [Spirochaetales bacterium]
MPKKTIEDIDLSRKRVLMRADFNVPIKEGRITDDTRIRAALPTINYILKQEGCSLILMSHLGRPKGEVKDELRLKPVADRLAELLSKNVIMAPDCTGSDVKKLAEALRPGEVMLLENLRFNKGETKNDSGLVKELASLGCDVYVNDAFGTAHRAHASTEGIAHVLPGVAGFLMSREIEFLSKIVENPVKPFVAIIGGAKVSTKIAVLESLLSKVSTLIIGGGMAYTFLKVKGYGIGKSLLEDEFLHTAKDLLAKAEKMGVEILLPVDHYVGDEFSENAKAQLVSDVNIPEGKIGMDVGPKTLSTYREKLANAKTILWNGPLGVFEFDAFAKGTLEVAKMVSESRGVSVVGGGDSVAAVNKFHLADKIDHVSTGGGASLEYLEGKSLPGIAALQDK